MTHLPGLFIVCVKYPERAGFVFGSNSADLDFAADRIYNHADLYGDHEDAEAYAFDANTRRVVLRFKGGMTRGGKAKTFCLVCHKTVPKHVRYQTICAKCQIVRDQGEKS